MLYIILMQNTFVYPCVKFRFHSLAQFKINVKKP